MTKLSPRSAFIEKAEIRNMSVECDRVGGINLAQGVCDTDIPEVVAAAYKAKRDKFCAALSKAGMKPWVPAGAYYVLADASGLLGRTGKDKAMGLLSRCGVGAVPGESFYRDGAPEADNLLRFCYAKRDAAIDEACRRLAAV
ncbi:MAG: aminotransferase [Elusimicrobia bacterium]|nr:MAG: aminotransferase [Elusimicrobiota bacterium]KAF0155565.1 MAG: aminotransferase [Elusimicrobiota bacterium]